jgi:peptidoglycan/xylan/chitin deacetylase (PgdA/CDA1 family)
MSLRQISKRTLGEALWPLAGKPVSRFFFRRERGLILMFHYLGAPIVKGVSEDLFLTVPEFTATLDFVRRSLCPLDPETFLTLLEQRNLPPGATLLTFDDCAASAVDKGLPELTSRGLKACFFANPGLVDAGRTVPSLELMDLCRSVPPGQYELHLPELTTIDISDSGSRAAAYYRLWPKILRSPSRRHAALFDTIRREFDVEGAAPDARLTDWDGVQRLHDAGMLVGNHTMFHSTVNADGIELFTADIDTAYRDLEKRFGPSRRTFCYPYGRTLDATPATTESLRNLRTAYGFVTQGGAARAGETDLLNLRREEASYSAGAVKLAPLLATIR